MNIEWRSSESFIVFECFDAVIKHTERVVEIAFQINAINNCSVLMNNGNSKMVSSRFASFDEANILTLTSEKDNKSTKRL